MKNVKIITVESDFGAGTRGAKLGPQALVKTLKKNDPAFGSSYPVKQIITPEPEGFDIDDNAKNIETVTDVQLRAMQAIHEVFEAGHLPFVFTGDHSNGLAGISALKNRYPNDCIGVIWIDAHADMHTPYTSPSGNLHGMPLAAALGLGSNRKNKNKVSDYIAERWNALLTLGDKKVNPKLKPADLVLIDTRDLEEEERNYITEQNIKCFTPAYKESLGIETIIAQTCEYLAHCDHLLVSFDVDSLDPTVSYGTGTPVPGGLSKEEAVNLLLGFVGHPKLRLLEITEINPIFDRNHPMEEVAASIVEQIMPTLTGAANQV